MYEISGTLTNVEPPMTPWGEAKYKAAKPDVGPRGVALSQSNDPVTKCFPPGVPRIYEIRVGQPLEIMQIPGPGSSFGGSDRNGNPRQPGLTFPSSTCPSSLHRPTHPLQNW
jgi:hypothetical protein